MEERVARSEPYIANIRLDVRELRTDMKAANEAIVGLRIAIARIDGKIDTLGAIVNALKREVDALEGRSAGSR